MISIRSIKTFILRIIKISTLKTFKTFILKIIQTFTLIKITNKIINKTPMIIIIINQNQIFLTNIRIYIIYIKNLYNFLKRIYLNKNWFLNFRYILNSFNLFIYFLYNMRYNLTTNFSIKLIFILF